MINPTVRQLGNGDIPGYITGYKAGEHGYYGAETSSQELP